MVIPVVMQVETLEDLSSRERAGARCYDTILLCKPHGLWNRRPDWMKQAWHHFLKFAQNNLASWCAAAAAAAAAAGGLDRDGGGGGGGGDGGGRLKACSISLRNRQS